MPAFDKIAVIIPSLNPDDKLLGVVDGLISRGFCDLIVVNDGSAPDKASYFETIAAYRRWPQRLLKIHPISYWAHATSRSRMCLCAVVWATASPR